MIRAIKPSSLIPWEVGILDDLARALCLDLDRIVIDKTGITGKYDFHLEFGANATTAGLNSMRGLMDR